MSEKSVIFIILELFSPVENKLQTGANTDHRATRRDFELRRNCCTRHLIQRATPVRSAPVERMRNADPSNERPLAVIQSYQNLKHTNGYK